MLGEDAGFTRVSLVADRIRCFPIGRAEDGAADSVAACDSTASQLCYRIECVMARQTFSHSVNLQFVPRNGEGIRVETRLDCRYAAR